MNPLRKFILLLACLLVGCSSTPATQFPEAQITPSKAVSEPTYQATPTVLLSLTALVSPTLTLTPMPSPVPALPTWTPLPTLLPESGLQTLHDWLKGSDDCRLPCWAEITPGETTWAEARQLIEPISGFAKLNIYSDTTCTFYNCNGIELVPPSSIYAHIYVGSQSLENKVHLIQMEISDPSLVRTLELKDVLNHYGKPAILLFYADPDQPGPKKIFGNDNGVP